MYANAWLLCLQVLSEGGRGDLALALASQNTYPSWGYMLTQGGTTLWEVRLAK